MFGLILGAVALLVIGFGGGWGVKHWKDGAEIALVNSQNSLMRASYLTPTDR